MRVASHSTHTRWACYLLHLLHVRRRPYSLHRSESLQWMRAWILAMTHCPSLLHTAGLAARFLLTPLSRTDQPFHPRVCFIRSPLSPSGLLRLQAAFPRGGWDGSIDSGGWNVGRFAYGAANQACSPSASPLSHVNSGERLAQIFRQLSEDALPCCNYTHNNFGLC